MIVHYLFLFRIPLDSNLAARTRDSVIKFIYGLLFSDIIDTCNGINSTSSQCISILDITGFGT